MDFQKKETRSTATRRMAILAHLDKTGQVNVKNLSNILNVSPVTIRNDLKQLENKNLLLRARGGAMRIADGFVGFDYPLSDKQKRHLHQKRQIGKRAAELIEEGDTIILDSGSTTFEIAKNLHDFQNLTVITNAINVANHLANHKNISVIVPGGTLRKNALSLVGMTGEKGLKHYFCDKLFLGVDGLDINFGISTQNNDEAHINQVMIDISKQVIVVADSSKFQRRAFAHISTVDKIHSIVTDKDICEEQKTKLERIGIEVIIAPAKGTQDWIQDVG